MNLSILIKYLLSFSVVLLLFGCNGLILYGEKPGPNYPFFITTEPTVVKKILVPKGTVLVYDEIFLKKGRQTKMMNEEKLREIKFLDTIEWGGVPVSSISRYFNRQISGFSVYADFKKLDQNKKTKFSDIWQSCNDDLGVNVRDLNDWSFNMNNIEDIHSCSVVYQRYFKNDKKQQKFLDDLYFEMKKLGDIARP